MLSNPIGIASNFIQESLNMISPDPRSPFPFPVNSNVTSTYYQQALAYVTENPILFSSYFKVSISYLGNNITPNALPNEPTHMRGIPLICESAELPGRTFALTEQKTYGPSKKFPILTAYNDITLSFVCLGVNNEIVPKKFFEDWMEYINPQSNYNFRYKDSYTAKIFIEQYTPSGDLIYKAELIGAFPISISAQRLNSSSQEQHTLQVTFTYTEFTPGKIYVDKFGTSTATFSNFTL